MDDVKNPDTGEDLTVDTVVDTQEPKEEGQEEDKRFKTLDAQRLKYKERAAKAEAERDELKKQLEAVKPAGESKPQETTDESKMFELMSIKVENPYLDEQDIQKAKSWAQLNGITLTEAVKDPLLQASLREKHAETISRMATPKSSTRSSATPSGINLEQLTNDPSKFHQLTKEQKDEVRKALRKK